MKRRSLNFAHDSAGGWGKSLSPSKWSMASSLLIRLQHGQKRLLRNLDLADLLHPFLAGGLLGPELALASDVAAVALGGHVLFDGRNGLAGDDPAADGGLDGDLEQMAVDLATQLLDEPAAAALGLRAVDDDREGVHTLAGDEDVEPDQVGGAVAEEFVVHRAVAVRHGLELVVQVIDHFSERQLVDEDGPRRTQVLGPDVDGAALGTHLHQIADVFARQQETDADDRLAELLDLSSFRHFLRTVDGEDLAFAGEDFVGHIWGGLHQLQLTGALKPLLDDLAVEEAEEAAAEAEAEPLAVFRLVGEAGIVEPQLAKRLAERLEVLVVDRVEAAI